VPKVSESDSAAQVVRPPLQLGALPVDKPLPAVAFLKPQKSAAA